MSAVLVLLHGAALLVALLLVGGTGRAVARLLRQPPVIGEIVAGLLVGPALVLFAGHDGLAAVLPEDVRALLRLVAEGALVLFLVGLARELRVGPARGDRRLAWVTAGALVPALACGVLVALWVQFVAGPAVRGDAPMPAFVLGVAVTLSITAVPVLARLLTERGLTETTAGALALAAAVVVDVVGWLLLSLAVGLGAGDPATFGRAMAVLAGALLLAGGIRWVLRRARAALWCGRWPAASAVVLGVVALVVGFGVHLLGLTAVFGAILVGLAVPPGEPWDAPTAAVSRLGRSLLPIFFVSAGLTALTGAVASTPWSLVVVVLVLGLAGKIGGGYLGSRLGGCSPAEATRIGILLNTRGLTELIVLQVAFQAGILSPPLFLALLIMALVTTLLTGPLLSLADRFVRAADAGDSASGAVSGPSMVSPR
ncbi:cation:proton antiporter [Micromonospora aurantiaca]|uniref:cation:proton antiporter n=1 Tax=Micromonospora aurantiaca (nom. illeg.) TaxID=47850 RepID=UPI0008276F2C|nr:cation:proton antiporter [Micromonospora aurantiaca]MBC9002744.1 cation:proton antiporter [Micromonospora aurantiaca]SCL43677.1 transporter, CPA2 family [Micromonospora aurantiaca]